MRVIFTLLFALGVSANANWLLDPNTVLCTVVGESTMNGNPESVDKTTCRKLSEYKEDTEPVRRETKPFCEFDFETGKFSTSYGEIPGAVIEKYNDRVYTGWSGKVKYIEDKLNIGIDILEEIKRCNIEASQFMNEYIKRRSVEGFGRASFLYESPGNVFDTYNEVMAFVSSSMDMYDCDYDCEVHKEGAVFMDSMTLLDELGDGRFSLNAVKNDTLYGVCKALKVGCIDAIVDNNKLSQKLREGLGLRGKGGEEGWIDKLENTKESLIDKMRENTHFEGTLKLNTEGLNFKLSEYANNPDSKMNDYQRSYFLDSYYDPFSNMVSVANTCSAPRGTLSFDLPDLNLCNLDDYDSDFLKERLRNLKEQLRGMRDQLVETMTMNMVNTVLNSMGEIKYINELQAYAKKAQCLVQATVLQATDTESLLAAQEKFASCRKTPQKTETSTDAQAGVRWFTAVTATGPIMLPLTQGTAGAGATLDPKAVAASTDETIKCITAGLGASYEKAYEKCLKGEEFSLTTDFMAELKTDIIPELDEFKQQQCVLDKAESEEDYVALVEKEVKEVRKKLKEARGKKYLGGLKERILNSSKENVAEVVSAVEKNPHDDAPIIRMFLKESVRECIKKGLEDYEKTQAKKGELMEISVLRDIQGSCISEKNYDFDIKMAGGMRVVAKTDGDVHRFEFTAGSKGTNIYSVDFRTLEEVYETIKLELTIDRIDLENKLYMTMYEEKPEEMTLLMRFYKFVSGITGSLFNQQVSEIQEKIATVDTIPHDNVAKVKRRRSAISNIMRKCSRSRLSRKEKIQCGHFKKNRSVLKMYGGMTNAE